MQALVSKITAITGKIAARNRYRNLEIALWLFSAACFALLASVALAAVVAHRGAQMISVASGPFPSNSSQLDIAQADASHPDTSRPRPAQVIGRIEIPALSLSVPITSGIETSSLLTGVGFVEGTARPGGLGTTVLAGHRDTYLRPLEHIAKGMQIRLISTAGAYSYIVDSWEIVLPEQVEAVSIHSQPELALVTCYPFHYIGAAPKRFIVHAHLESLIPESATPATHD